MKENITLLDVVALLKDKPDKNLVAGQVGTVVEELAPDTFEIEFIDETGKTYAMEALNKKDLIHLHYAPVKTA